jgi:hypothetical protein
MQCHAVSLEKIDVSEVRTASIFAIMMEAVRTSEMSVYFETTLRYIPEESKLPFFLLSKVF